MEYLSFALQAITVLVSLLALMQSRRAPGRRAAERAETSLRLVESMRVLGESSALPTLSGEDPTIALVARLADDARFNTARYLQAANRAGSFGTPLVSLAALYFVLFVAMGWINLSTATTSASWWAALAILLFGVAMGCAAAIGARRRWLDRQARHDAGLSVETFASTIRDVRIAIVNRRAKRQQTYTDSM